MSCLAHVINLTVQAFLGPTGLCAQAPDQATLEATDARGNSENNDEQEFTRGKTPSGALKKLRRGIQMIR